MLIVSILTRIFIYKVIDLQMVGIVGLKPRHKTLPVASAFASEQWQWQ